MRVPAAHPIAIPLLLLGACSAPGPAPEPGPLGLPEWTIETGLAPGSSLSGPSGGPLGEESEDARAIVTLGVRLLYLERDPGLDLAPIEGVSSLVADLLGSRPLLSSITLAAGARWGVGAAAEAWLDAAEEGAGGRVSVLFDEVLALPRGATVSVAVGAFETVEDPLDWLDEYPDRGPILRRVAVSVSDSATGPRVALAIDDLDPEREAERLRSAFEQEIIRAEPPGPAEEERVRRETLLLDVAPREEADLLLVWRSPFEGGEGRFFAARLSLEPASDQAEFEDLAEELRAVARAHAQRVEPLAHDQFEALEREQALVAFRSTSGRSALLLLANDVGAGLTEQLALIADQSLLDELSQEVFGPDEAVASPDIELAWRLERASWTLLARRGVEETLDPVGQAALLRHGGALGRFPDVLLDLVAASSDLAGFARRLVTEQRYFLEDSDPSARLRAHEWLLARGCAVPGYDPLAERAERRAALKAFEEDGTR